MNFGYKDWDNREWVLEKVAKDGATLERTSERLRGDKGLVMEAVGNCGRALEYASAELRDDREVVLEAVSAYPWALEWASERLRGNNEIVLVGLEQAYGALNHVSKEVWGLCRGLLHEDSVAALKMSIAADKAAAQKAGLERELVPVVGVVKAARMKV